MNELKNQELVGLLLLMDGEKDVLIEFKQEYHEHGPMKVTGAREDEHHIYLEIE